MVILKYIINAQSASYNAIFILIGLANNNIGLNTVDIDQKTTRNKIVEIFSHFFKWELAVAVVVVSKEKAILKTLFYQF